MNPTKGPKWATVKGFVSSILNGFGKFVNPQQAHLAVPHLEGCEDAKTTAHGKCWVESRQNPVFDPGRKDLKQCAACRKRFLRQKQEERSR